MSMNDNYTLFHQKLTTDAKLMFGLQSKGCKPNSASLCYTKLISSLFVTERSFSHQTDSPCSEMMFFGFVDVLSFK